MAACFLFDGVDKLAFDIFQIVIEATYVHEGQFGMFVFDVLVRVEEDFGIFVDGLVYGEFGLERAGIVELEMVRVSGAGAGLIVVRVEQAAAGGRFGVEATKGDFRVSPRKYAARAGQHDLLRVATLAETVDAGVHEHRARLQVQLKRTIVVRGDFANVAGRFAALLFARLRLGRVQIVHERF